MTGAAAAEKFPYAGGVSFHSSEFGQHSRAEIVILNGRSDSGMYSGEQSSPGLAVRNPRHIFLLGFNFAVSVFFWYS